MATTSSLPFTRKTPLCFVTPSRALFARCALAFDGKLSATARVRTIGLYLPLEVQNWPVSTGACTGLDLLYFRESSHNGHALGRVASGRFAPHTCRIRRRRGGAVRSHGPLCPRPIDRLFRIRAVSCGRPVRARPRSGLHAEVPGGHVGRRRYHSLRWIVRLWIFLMLGCVTASG
jgi:hypothetical protein